ncbi:MAG: [protein-PII] uridylyltransferase [Acidimicrobiales bacterium]
MPETFAEDRRALLADPCLRGLELARAHADLVDSWLAGLLGDEAGVALVAVGGHGRRELFPASDLDLVLVHRGRRSIAAIAAIAERVWYPVWDAHLALDHSVRTVREALAVARDDLKAALGLLDARFVAGDPDLAADLVERSRRQWRDGARRNLGLLEAMCAERHENEGELAFLLEPDIKEAKGGLRDLTAIRAMAAGAPILGPSLAEVEPALAQSARVLSDVRVELHRQSGRDRLLLQEQDAVAAALDVADADVLMAQVAGAARTLAWACDDAWRRVRSWLAGPRGRAVAPEQVLGPGIVLREGEVEVLGSAPLADPGLILRAADAAANNRARLSRAALSTLAMRSQGLDPLSPWPPEALQALVSLLGAGRPAVEVLEDLDQWGLLVRVLPEWAPVRSRPQRNAYHRFTVDRHLLEAAAGAAALVRRVGRPDLLLVGALLHDLGKGYPGDHSQAGIALMEEIGPRLGFSPEDVAYLVAMVRHHLLLPDVATRRDLTDPSTIETVAGAVGDRTTLDLLAALTEADSLATGDLAWSPWKAGLVGELVDKVGRALAGQPPAPLPAFPLARHKELVARASEGWVVVGKGDRLTVVAPDRAGLFSLVTGALALEGLTVLSADAWSGIWDGAAVAVSEHVVRPELGGDPDWDNLRARLAELAGAPELVEPALARRSRTYSGRQGRTGLGGSGLGRTGLGRAGLGGAGLGHTAEVRFDLDASSSATVVELWAADELGLLHRVTRALANLGLDIRHAKAQTLGHEVVDTFYVLDATGAKLTDPGALASLEAALLSAAGAPAAAQG